MVYAKASPKFGLHFSGEVDVLALDKPPIILIRIPTPPDALS